MTPTTRQPTTGQLATGYATTGPGSDVSDWLGLPHHDGSELYVSTATPRLGDTVTVWVRVPVQTPLDHVHVRTVRDGEPEFVAARVDEERSTGVETWWAADLRCHNHVTSYRFILAGGPTRYAWLNGAGLHLRDVPDAGDFRIVADDRPPPAWAREAVVYQVFPDRFARSAAADGRDVPAWALPAAWSDPVVPRDTPDHGLGRQLYGGDLDGVVEHLDHIEALGATTVYLTPFFPAGSNHRYDASTFTTVDPLLGGEEALRRLSDAVHARGMTLLGDFTTNHTGEAHEWFVAARADPAAPERDHYFWLSDGGSDSDTSTDTSTDYVAWLGVPSLPKLNYASAQLRQRVFDDPQGVVRRWLDPDGGLDGWRVDVANMTGRQGAQDLNQDVAAQMRTAVVEAHPDALLVGEHCHDYSLDVPGDGWHGVMNYAGFCRPLWTWLCDPDDAPDFLGSPVLVPRLGGAAVVETIRDFTSRVSWRALTFSFNLVGSHDTTRIRTLVGDDARLVDVAAGLLFTLPSVPMMTYGDEIGMEGQFGEDGRRTMPWDGQGWDERLLAVYRDLIGLRRGSSALTHGGLRWVHADDDVLVFLRESRTQVALVHVARAAHEPLHLDRSLLPGIEDGLRAFGRGVEVAGSTVVLTADGPTVAVTTWTSTSWVEGAGRRDREGGETAGAGETV